MPLVESRADVPVTIDASLCIEGCTLYVDICPLDSLAMHQGRRPERELSGRAVRGPRQLPVAAKNLVNLLKN